MDYGLPAPPGGFDDASPETAMRSRCDRAWQWLTRWTLRRKILAGFVVSLVPLILLLAHTVEDRFAARRADELRSNREFAEAVAATLDAYVSDIDHQLLAQSFTLGWRLDLENRTVVQAYLALNRAPYPSLAALALTDPDGRLIAADPPQAVAAGLGDEPYIRAARDAPGLVVSDLLPAAGGAPPRFAAARSVQRAGGEVVGVLTAYVDAGSLGSVLGVDRPGHAAYAVLDRQGRVVYDSQHADLSWEQRDFSGLPQVQAAAQGRAATSASFASPIDGTRRLGAAVPVPRLGWIAMADRPVEEALGPIEDTARREAAIAALAVLAALLLAMALAVSLTRPLRTLQQAVAAVRGGDYGQRLDVRGRDEVADLMAGFNEMVARLEALEQERADFTAMISHDLRSPLTAVRGYAELLRRRAPGGERSQRMLASIVRESERVARLAADLGDSASAATGRLEIHPQRVDLAALVEDAVERLRAVDGSRPTRLDTPPGPLWVDADPVRIAQVLDNLLGNAAKYSPPDQPIIVQAWADTEARVSVEDRGPGIPPEELPHLFDRFYRAPNARRGTVAGTGLGLYISQAVAMAHHGLIAADSAPGQGSRFTLVLPLAAPPTRG